MISLKQSVSVVVWCGLFATGGKASAALLLTIGNAAILPGGTGFVDVTVASDNPSGDKVAFTSFEFRITSAGATRLEFINPQTDSGTGLSNYIFFGNSVATLFPPLGNVSTKSAPSDTLIGGDSTNNGADVTIAGPTLMARLDLSAATALPPANGDHFTIQLVPSLDTGFLDSQLNPVRYSPEGASGTVTIGVPEPASWALSLLALATLPLVRRRRVE
ncbi:MAG: hypothetical protein HYX69_20080 [Planctomycetia bacterium]|nr:hypothetical protein [Planctomycetia bacterium]